MNSRRGQSLLISIGIILAIIIVVIIGANIFLKVAIRNEPEVIAKDAGLTAQAVLAAPENVEIKLKAPLPSIRKAFVGTWDGYFHFVEITFGDGEAKGYKISSRVWPFRTPETEKDYLVEFNLECGADKCTVQPHKLLGDKTEEEPFVTDKYVTADDYGKFYYGKITRTYNSASKKYAVKTQPLEVK
jgi:hypothetical protein